MPLTLTVKSYQQLSPDRESTITLSHGRFSIGRSAEADWSLPDPERLVSKFHCNIDALGDSYILTDTSTNGVFVNGATVPVGCDNKVGLSSGDQLRLGAYEIEVSVSELTQPVKDKGQAALEETDDDPPLASPSASNVELPPEGTRDEGFSSGLSPKPAIDGSGDSDILVDRGLLDLPPRDLEAETSAQDSETSDPGSPELEGIDKTDLNLAEPIEDEPVAGETTAPKNDAHSGRLKPESFAPKEHATTAAANNSGTALGAFFEGAALEVPPTRDEDDEVRMRELGQLYRVLVEGMMDTMAAGARFKKELPVEQTMAQPQQNNPLKLATGTDHAMNSLLRKPSKGGMPPTDALREAFDDLKAQQIASLAGLQSGLQAVVARFAPETLGRRLDQSRLSDSILPGSRKARYWSAFQQLYSEIAKEAEDDFKKRFGEAFAKAYEKETKTR